MICEEFVRQQAIQARCFNPTDKWEAFPRSALDGSIVTRFEEMAAHYPRRLAVKMDDGQLTYAELNQAANRVAHTLVAQLGMGSEPIALLFEQGIDMLVALLGVLKAGKFYVPLSPQEPIARTQSMLADVQAKVLVTNSLNANLAHKLAATQIQIVNIEKLAPQRTQDNLNVPIAPDDFAYIIYTSGSTGQPKGVIETHRNVLHFVWNYNNHEHYAPSDRFGLTYAYTFSGAASSLYSALLNGAAIFPYDMVHEGSDGLANWLVKEEITVVSLAPAIFRQFAGRLQGAGHFPALRLLRLGADRVLKSDIVLYQRHFSANCIFQSVLGTSEVKAVACYFVDQTMQCQDEIVPAGYPVEDIEVLILDEVGHELGFDQIGEIAARSRYVSPGYWRKPELTKARFLPALGDPQQRIYLTGDLGKLRADGCLFHLGRNDAQVKILGQMVATIEVETALLTLDAVREAVVIVEPAADSAARLVAYVVAKQQPRPTVTHIRKALTELLPPHMIPAAFVFLDAFPLNTNHKIDRRALPAPDHDRPLLDSPYIAPRTPLEETLVAIWEEVLAIHPIGVADHFLDLGGNSLHTTQVQVRVLNHWSLDLPVRRLFDCATIAELALLITQQQAALTDPSELAQLLAALEMAPARALQKQDSV